MEILLSIVLISVTTLSLYATYLTKTKEIQKNIYMAFEEIWRVFKRASGDNVYREGVRMFSEVGNFLVRHNGLEKQSYSNFKASTVRRKPSILFIIVSTIYALSIIAEVFLYLQGLIVELHKILC